MSQIKKCIHNIIPTTAEDKQVVIEFLRKFFFQDEPLILGINMLEDIDSLANLENYCFNILDTGERNSYKIIKCNASFTFF